MKPRRLRGHKGTVTCCVAASARPGIIASSGEDGCICWFDLRCKDVFQTMEVGEEPISSLCFKAGNEDVVYISSGTKISCFDRRMESPWKPLERYNYNKDEINQIACSSKSGFIAAADDSGIVKIVDSKQKCLYKSLRAVHTNICSSVQFIPWKPWAAISGGLDLKLAIWDFSKGRPLHVIDYGASELDKNASLDKVGQCLNPAFIHSIAVPEADMLGGLYRVCAAARGDGVVEVIDLEPLFTPVKSKGHSCSTGQTEGKRMHLDYTLGGHTAAVSCVSFSTFADRGKFIISGGNDASVKIWDWSKRFSSETGCDGDLVSTIDVNKKVNWLCTSPSESENLVVCDTSKVLKVYTVQ